MDGIELRFSLVKILRQVKSLSIQATLPQIVKYIGGIAWSINLKST